MAYIDRTLAPGEAVVFRARLHWIMALRAWAALVFLGVVLVGIAIFVRDMIFLNTTEVALTSSRLIKKWGWLSLHTSELELSSVEAVSVDQSVWGRMLNYGRIQIHGTGDDVWTSPLIADPIRFRREVEGVLAPQRA